jgi:hypothetical protein
MNPEARDFVWNVCRENYYKYGIDFFWLDNAEPDYAVYDYCNYRYFLGPALKVSNIYPLMYAKAFYDGQHGEKQKKIVNLVRSAWVGIQKYATLIWSIDVLSTFEVFQGQIASGLNIVLAGLPWWTPDIGGFMYGDVHDPAFKQLLLRWFQFAAFCPVLRMHGDRDPHDRYSTAERRQGLWRLPVHRPVERTVELWERSAENYAEVCKDSSAVEALPEKDCTGSTQNRCAYDAYRVLRISAGRKVMGIKRPIYAGVRLPGGTGAVRRPDFPHSISVCRQVGFAERRAGV